MSYLPILPLVIVSFTIIVNLLLGGIVYRNNPKSATSIIFSILCWITSLWLVTNYIFGLPLFFDYALLLSKLSIFFAVPQILSFFLLALTLPHEKLGLKRKTFFKIFILGTVIMMLTLSPYAFESIEFTHNAPNPTPGPGLIPFVLFAITFSTSALYVLLKRLKNSVGIEKQQLRLVTYGMLIMIGLIILTILLPVSIFKNTFFVQLTPLYTLFFLGMTTYAIVKHRLLDIRMVVARAVSYTLIISLFGIFYVLLFTIFSSIITSQNMDAKTVFTSTILALIMVFSFQSVRRFIEQYTDRIFYKGHYDSNRLLYNLALIMASALRLEDLTKSLLHKLLTEMRITRASFILLDKEQGYRVFYEGYQSAPVLDSQKVIKLLSPTQAIYIFEETPECEIKELMRTLQFNVILYLKIKSGYIGLLGLGEKRSGELYSQRDLRLLEILAPEAAVAIQNAISYEEIKKFNITLQERVDVATKDLRQANERLQALDKLKDEFISIASHELRTPMTAIKNYLWTVVYKTDLPQERKNHYIEGALKSTVRLIALVNDMLNVSRIESGRIKLEPVSFSVIDLAKEVDEELMIKAKERSITLTIQPATIPNIFADKDKIREVLINLIGNALKFTPKNGKITVSFKEKEGFIETAVADTGKGISKEDFPKLFKKFGRLDNTLVSVAETEGTGLGLYICQQFIELSKGKIWIESELGKGSTFTFSLPVFQEQQK